MAAKQKEAPLIRKELALLNSAELEQKRQHEEGTITIDRPVCIDI